MFQPFTEIVSEERHTVNGVPCLRGCGGVASYVVENFEYLQQFGEFSTHFDAPRIRIAFIVESLAPYLRMHDCLARAEGDVHALERATERDIIAVIGTVTRLCQNGDHESIRPVPRRSGYGK